MTKRLLTLLRIFRMKTPETIVIGSKKIVYLDFSGLKKNEDVKAQIDSYSQFIHKARPKSLVTITNLENMHFNTDIFNCFVNYVKSNNAYVTSSAVIGMRGLMQIFYKSFIKVTGRNVVVCETKEEAIAAFLQKERC